MKLKALIAGGALLALTACAPGAIDQAAESVASALPSLPPGAQATAQSLVTDPGLAATAQALASGAVESLEGLIPSDLRFDQNQPLVLNTTRQVAGVTNYRWVISDAPEGSNVEGQVIAENSDGQLTLQPSDYAQYFPVSGNYTIDLILTFENGTSQTQQIPLVVP